MESDGVNKEYLLILFLPTINFLAKARDVWILAIHEAINNKNHWLTPRKGIYLFRYFLPTMRTPVQLFPPHAYMHFYCFAVYALSAKTPNAVYQRSLVYALSVRTLDAHTSKQ